MSEDEYQAELHYCVEEARRKRLEAEEALREAARLEAKAGRLRGLLKKDFRFGFTLGDATVEAAQALMNEIFDWVDEHRLYVVGAFRPIAEETEDATVEAAQTLINEIIDWIDE